MTILRNKAEWTAILFIKGSKQCTNEILNKISNSQIIRYFPKLASKTIIFTVYTLYFDENFGTKGGIDYTFGRTMILNVHRKKFKEN